MAAPVPPRMNLDPAATPWGNWVQSNVNAILSRLQLATQNNGISNAQQASTITNLQKQVNTLNGLVTSLTAQVNAAIAANSYTSSQIDSKIANPGNIAPINVNASGQVISAGIVNSPGTKANTVTVGYSAVYIDSSGNMGGNTSSRRFKQDISPVEIDTADFLTLEMFRYRYIDAVEELGDGAAWETGLIAEDVVKVAPWACFYEADGVTVRGINYDRLTVALLAVAKDQERRIAALEAA